MKLFLPLLFFQNSLADDFRRSVDDGACSKTCLNNDWSCSLDESESEICTPDSIVYDLSCSVETGISLQVQKKLVYSANDIPTDVVLVGDCEMEFDADGNLDFTIGFDDRCNPTLTQDGGDIILSISVGGDESLIKDEATGIVYGSVAATLFSCRFTDEIEVGPIELIIQPVDDFQNEITATASYEGIFVLKKYNQDNDEITNGTSIPVGEPMSLVMQVSSGSQFDSSLFQFYIKECTATDTEDSEKTFDFISGGCLSNIVGYEFETKYSSLSAHAVSFRAFSFEDGNGIDVECTARVCLIDQSTGNNVDPTCHVADDAGCPTAYSLNILS